MAASPSPSAFTTKQLKLIEMEREDEIAKTEEAAHTHSARALQALGLCFAKLRVEGIATGFGGRYVVTLGSNNDNVKELPSTDIRPGDIVMFSRPDDASGSNKKDDTAQFKMTGVVSSLNTTHLAVALDDEAEPDTLPPVLRVDRMANNVTYQRMVAAMKDIDEYPAGGPAAKVRSLLLGDSKPSVTRSVKITPINPNLAPDQIAAVEFALGRDDLAIIHGPPGTGKTTTLVEFIRQVVAANEDARVLVCAGSNLAVDNVAMLLARTGIAIARIGHPTRMQADVWNVCLDALIQKSDGFEIIKDLQKEIDTNLKELKGMRRDKRHQVYGEVKALRKDLRLRERANEESILEGSKVILTTNVGAGQRKLQDLTFDVVVIDECGQATEATTWIPLLKGKKLVLAGDHCQLPPTVISERAAKKGFDVSLMERMVEKYGDEVTVMLTTQYRMPDDIMEWASKAMYESKVRSAPGNAPNRLTDLVQVRPTDVTSTAMVWIDTAGMDFFERMDEDLGSGDSKSNDGEANLVLTHVRALVSAGVSVDVIGVITPYHAQVGRIRETVRESFPSLFVGTVDSFQGMEREAIIISLVRSNDDGEVGFLAEDRRLNVAVTRARRHVCVIGDSGTVCNHPFIETLFEHINECGEYIPAQTLDD